MAIPFITQLPEAPRRTDARPDFALRADVFFAAIDPMRYQMNQMAAWMNDQRDDIYSYSDNVEAWMNATLAARNAAQAAATNAAASESAAKDHLDDTAALIAGFTPTGDPLPEVTSVNAPLIVATPQGGVKFSRRALNSGIGVRPALRFDFANQGYLDPRITFTRNSRDFRDGKVYEIDEPVITEQGLWSSGERTNLLTWGGDIEKWSHLSVYFDGGFAKPTSSNGGHAVRDSLNLAADTDYVLSAFFETYGNIPVCRITLPQSSGTSGVFIDTRDLSIRYVDATEEHTKATITPHGNGFIVTLSFRCLVSDSHQISLSATPTNLSSNYVGDGDSGFRYTDIQLETGTTPTPYIPTEASQVTVAASIPRFLLERKNFTLFFEGEIKKHSLTTRYATLVSAIKNNDERIRFMYDKNPDSLFLSGRTDSSGITNQVVVLRDMGEVEPIKAAISYSHEGITWGVNGITGSYPYEPSADISGGNVFIGTYNGTSSTVDGFINNYIRSVSLYEGSLSIQQLQDLTS